MKKKAPHISHEKEQIREFRKNPELATEYLNSAIQVAFEENDPELVLIALATVARAHGMTHVAKDADLKRESLHRMLSKRGNPEWNSIFRVFKALHLRPQIAHTAHSEASLVKETSMELPGETHLTPIFERKYKSHFNKAVGLQTCALDLISQELAPKGLCHMPKGTDNQKHVFMLMLSKALKTFRALSLLASRGLDSDAMILLRTLVELRISLRFILTQDSEILASKYLAFANVINRFREAQAFDLDPQTEDPDLWKEVQSAQAAFGKEWWDKAIGYGRWGEKSIGKMAGTVGLEALYKRVYAKACEATHGSDASDHVSRSESGDFSLAIMSKDDWIQYCLEIGNTVFSDILLDLIAAIQLPTIDAWTERIHKQRISEDDWDF